MNSSPRDITEVLLKEDLSIESIKQNADRTNHKLL